MSDSVLHVVGGGRRSLFDQVRPDDVRAEGQRIRGPGGMALAALRHPGVTGGETTVTDAVVIGGRALGRAREGWYDVAESEAIAIGYGVGAIRLRRTAGGRTWVLLRMGALRDGAVLEAMAALPDLPPVSLCPVIVGDAIDGARMHAMLTAMGIDVHDADNDDEWSVLSAMDRAVRAAEHRCSAVLATRSSA